MCKCHCNVLSTCIQTVFLFSGAGLRVSQHLQGTSWRLSGMEFDLSLVWFGPLDPDPTSCFRVLSMVFSVLGPGPLLFGWSRSRSKGTAPTPFSPPPIKNLTNLVNY